MIHPADPGIELDTFDHKMSLMMTVPVKPGQMITKQTQELNLDSTAFQPFI